VTLSIIWEEYIEQHLSSYRYSRFCELYRSWEGRLSVTMRQSHAGGEKLFVDYAGDGVPITGRPHMTGTFGATGRYFLVVLGPLISPKTHSFRAPLHKA
jgi:transposase